PAIAAAGCVAFLSLAATLYDYSRNRDEYFPPWRKRPNPLASNRRYRSNTYSQIRKCPIDTDLCGANISDVCVMGSSHRMKRRLKLAVPVTFSTSAKSIARARQALEAVVRRTGARHRFSVSVSECVDPDAYEIIVIDMDRMQSKLYQGGNRWISKFARDIAGGMFSS